MESQSLYTKPVEAELENITLGANAVVTKASFNRIFITDGVLIVEEPSAILSLIRRFIHLSIFRPALPM